VRESHRLDSEREAHPARAAIHVLRTTMNRQLFSSLLALCAATAWTSAGAPAQGRKADWPTDGGDGQRTAWQRHETLLTRSNVKDMTLLWTVKTDNAPRQMHNLFPPMIAGNVSTPAGEREIAVLAGVSDNVYGIDVATGRQLWHRKFD